VRFDWDPAKNERNIAKHGIDFASAILVFTSPRVLVVQSNQNEEERYAAIGPMGSVMITVVYTDRQHEHTLVRRIISARRARRNERKAYENA
jgi:uncharacterized DUF497 family protein